MPSQLLFLPGALGRTRLWAPVADRLTHPAPKRRVGWPGFGDTPPDPQIHGLADLAQRVAALVDRPTALIAQSMGGVIALRVALQKPEKVTHLVLAATSGGIDVARLGGEDWRADFYAAHPRLPRWFADDRQDLSAQLANVAMPVLLLWGERDPVSPLPVAEHLASLLPAARLRIVQGGGHDLAKSHASLVASWIDQHLCARRAGVCHG